MVGAGQTGVLAAIGVKRALPACQVIVVAVAPDPAAFADHAATALPFTNRLHDRLGITEESLLLKAGASHRLIAHMIGWGAPQSDGQAQHGAVPYGATLEHALMTRFANDWGGGSKNSGGENTSAGSLAQLLAEAGRFCVPPGNQPSPVDDVDYALRWNPPAYRDLLIGLARQLGVDHVQGDIATIAPDDAGGIAAIQIAGAGRLEADLFIDCSGTGARLLAALRQTEQQDWGNYLPLRRIIVAQPGLAMLALEDRFTMLPEGWLCEFAGRDGLQVTLGSSGQVSDNAAVQALGGAAIASIPLMPGRVVEPWAGNVVALGDAAARFEPLGFLNLDLAHRQLGLLLEMLPGRQIEPLERREYNRRSGLMMDAVRDTLGMHYAAPQATNVFGKMRRSDRLSLAIDQFTRRGRLPFWEEAPLLGQEYMALLGALGFVRGITPQSRSTGQREADEAGRAFSAKAQAALQFAPPYADFMGAVLQQAGPPR
ncbi:tryptophan 7-halogenase [Aurantiacibacter marinus]|uniref:tryptophan 7-halogenase n=1 Tax=Aurantiacibacter marinus TaxID=874156 RepID=UPI0022B20C4C|nr:tryptophan 7-halogenase [Aurantiacibacter marinus]